MGGEWDSGQSMQLEWLDDDDDDDDDDDINTLPHIFMCIYIIYECECV